MKNLAVVSKPDNYASIDMVRLRQFLAAIKPVQSLSLDQLTISRIGHQNYLIYRNRLMNLSMPIPGSWENCVSFPLSQFLTSIGKTKKGQVDISDFGETLGVTVSGGRINIPVVSRENVPGMPIDSCFGPSVVVRPFWSGVLGKVCQNDSPRNYGTVVKIEAGFTKLVATDGFRLALVDSGLTCSDKESYTLSRSCFMSLSALLAGDTGQVSYSEDSTTMKVRGTEITAYYRLSMVKYPEYQRIMPDLLKYKGIEVDRKLLIDNLKLCKPLTDKSRAIRLDFSYSGIIINIMNKDAVNNFISVPVKDCVPMPSVSLNCQFLIDALGSKEKLCRVYVKDQEDPIQINIGNEKTILVPIMSGKDAK